MWCFVAMRQDKHTISMLSAQQLHNNSEQADDRHRPISSSFVCLVVRLFDMRETQRHIVCCKSFSKAMKLLRE